MKQEPEGKMKNNKKKIINKEIKGEKLKKQSEIAHGFTYNI